MLSHPGIIGASSVIGTVPQALTLDLPATSDSGASSTDNITSSNTPNLDIIFGTSPLAGDTVEIRDGSSTIATHTVTSGEISSGTIALGLPALSDGTHSLTARHSRGGQSGAWSSALSVTIDTIAPVLSAAAGAQNGVIDTQADLSVTTDTGEGTVYWVVTTNSSAPTSSQVVSGADASGVAVASGLSGYLSAASAGAKTATASGLATGTWYAFFTHVDIAGNASAVLPSSGWSQAAAAFAANAVNFNGSTYLTNAAPAGLANGQSGIISFWIRNTGGDGTTRYFFFGKDGVGTKLFMQLTTINTVSLTIRDAASANAVFLQSSGAGQFATGTPWTHVAFAWNLSSSLGQVYINGTNLTSSTKTLGTNPVYAYTAMYLGSNNGAGFIAADVAEFYCNLHETLDLSVPTSLQKFRSSGGAPVNLGPDGSTPTGTQPEIYLGGAHTNANWQANLGDSGNFNVTAGSLSSAVAP